MKSKRVRPRTIHSPRERRSARGKLVQIDGSPHVWYEARADKCCLIAFIDDATSQVMSARFYPVQSTAAHLDSLQRYVSEHGRPVALYNDRHCIFTKHDPEDTEPTEFERAVGKLNIESVLAYSPQAKGSPRSCLPRRAPTHRRHTNRPRHAWDAHDLEGYLISKVPFPRFFNSTVTKTASTHRLKDAYNFAYSVIRNSSETVTPWAVSVAHSLLS